MSPSEAEELKLTPRFSEGRLSCGVAWDWCPLHLAQLIYLAKRVSQSEFILCLCHFPPAPLITVFNQQFNSFLHSYLLFVSQMKEARRLKTPFFLKKILITSLRTNKNEIVSWFCYNNLFFIAWLYRIIIGWLTCSIWNCQFSMVKFQDAWQLSSGLCLSLPCLLSLVWLDYTFQTPWRRYWGWNVAYHLRNRKTSFVKHLQNANEFLDL